MPTWVLVAAVLALWIHPGAAVAETAGASTTAVSRPVLYLHTAQQGTLRPDGDRWRLTFYGSSPRIVTFAHQPAQAGRAHQLSELVTGWRAAFGDAKPHAALEITDAPESQDVVLLELSPPELGARPGTVSYAVRPLTRTSRASLVGLAARADSGVPERFGHATLYIAATGGTISYQLSWDSDGGSFGVSFDNVTIESGSLIENYSQGNFVAVLPQGVSGQAAGASLPFFGGIQGNLTLPPSGPITGTADVPPGITVQIFFCGGSGVTLSNGAFSIPAPSGC